MQTDNDRINAVMGKACQGAGNSDDCDSLFLESLKRQNARLIQPGAYLYAHMPLNRGRWPENCIIVLDPVEKENV